ncbi:MAG: hypothetical protein JWO56_443, partial [Acidobacteria bacterium]|nr:hypothetical protein [Acidobacteriota bacterium]
RFAHCTSPGGVRAFFAAVARAVIVKPLSGTGSEGVARIDDADEIEAAWSLAAESRAFAGVICEEFIDGPEVSVEGYSAGGVYRGIAITDKITNAAFLEVGHAQPSAHPPAVQREVFRYTASVLAALRVTDGWTHTEIKLSTSGPVIIETHTRMGGGAIDVLTLRATGVSIPDVLFDLALGIPPSAQPVDTGEVAAVRFLLNRDAGIVHDVQVPPVPHAIAAWAVDVEVGGEVTARSASGNRLAWAVGTGSNIAAAVQAAESFLSTIRIDIVGKSQWTIPAA